MKVAIDARLYGTEFTGLGRYTMNLVDSLADIDSKNQYSILLRDKYYKKLKLPKNFSKFRAEFPIYSFQEQFYLPVLLNKLSPDITHFPHLNVPVLYGRRFIVTIHDIIMQKQGRQASTLPFPVYYLKRFPFKYTAHFAVKRSEKIICPSKAVKQEIIDFYKVPEGKIMVTYEGAGKNIKFDKDSKTDHGKYFFYVGNAYPHKNLKTLIKALKELNKGLDEEVEMFIRTDKNEFRERLERYAKQIDAMKHVDFVNRLSDSELGELYHKSLAFVFPSFTEGFGLPGLEAIQNRTLLAASDIPVFKEVYGDNALYFDPNDHKDLVKAMRKVLSLSKNERQKRIKESQTLLKSYSWRKMAQETRKVYELFKQ